MPVRNRAVARKTNSPYVPVGVGFISADPSPGLLAALEKERKLQIAERIRELRQNSPYTQEAIAERLGVTVRAYQKQEKTGGVSYENVEKLAGLHGVETDWILRGDKPATPDLLGANHDGSQLDRMEKQLNDVAEQLDALEVTLSMLAAAQAPARRTAARSSRGRTTGSKRAAS